MVFNKKRNILHIFFADLHILLITIKIKYFLFCFRMKMTGKNGSEIMYYINSNLYIDIHIHIHIYIDIVIGNKDCVIRSCISINFLISFILYKSLCTYVNIHVVMFGNENQIFINLICFCERFSLVFSYIFFVLSSQNLSFLYEKCNQYIK